MEIAVAVLFVCVALGFIFIRLTNARKEAERLRGEPEPEIAVPSVEASPVARVPPSHGGRRSLQSRLRPAGR